MIFTCVLLLILYSPCVLCKKEMRPKREPPVHRAAALYTPGYGPPRPVYGVPNYGPPKPIYGLLKSYGSPKPIYGLPKIIYGPPSRHIYSFPILNYERYYRRPSPSYYVPPLSMIFPSAFGPPSSYDVPIYPPHSYLSRRPQNYPPSDLPLLPPSENYGPPAHNYGPPSRVHPNYNTRPSTGDYGNAYSPPESIYTNYDPSSQEPHQPREGQLISPSEYESSHSSYEVPITQSPPALQYDASSASYGTPGAVTSYGTPIGNHNLEDLQKRINSSPYLQEPFRSFDEADTYSSSSNIAQVGEPFKVSSANKTCTQGGNIASNHNYDGPGVMSNEGREKNPVTPTNLNECN